MSAAPKSKAARKAKAAVAAESRTRQMAAISEEVRTPRDDGWHRSDEGQWYWRGMNWWRNANWQSWANANFMPPSIGWEYFARAGDGNAREDDAPWEENAGEAIAAAVAAEPWEASASEADVAAAAAEGTECAEDDRADEANVAAVAAGDAEGGDGDVSSEVSSTVFDLDPTYEDDAEFMNTHGGSVTPLVEMICISGVTPLVNAPDTDLHQRVAEREWNAAALARNEADRRALAAGGNGPLVTALGRAVAHEVAQSRNRA